MATDASSIRTNVKVFFVDVANIEKSLEELNDKIGQCFLEGMKVIVKSFEGFEVYQEGEGYSFVYVNFNDEDKLIDGLTDYLFDEKTLLKYASNSAKIKLNETDPKYWVILYKNISSFLNEDLENYEIDGATGELLNVLLDEYTYINVDGKPIIQKDKIGKVGEYAFHVIMSKYFGLDCIIHKFRCTTDRNMSVYGIDALFLDEKNKCIYFGESKFSKTLHNGIVLANKSLSMYESQIREEYRIILSSEDAFPLSPSFKRLFLDATQMCITFDKFISYAGISEIGIPVFVAHGKEKKVETPENYISIMKSQIKKDKMFGLKIKYIFISLPVIDKQKFVKVAFEKVVKKQHEFESKCP